MLSRVKREIETEKKERRLSSIRYNTTLLARVRYSFDPGSTVGRYSGRSVACAA